MNTCETLQPVTLDEFSPDQAQVWADVLAQAVTGELIGALNYESLAELYEDADEKAEAIGHAQGERGHAASYRDAGSALGIDVLFNPEAQYWKRIRSAFLSRVDAGDLIDCILAQEVMLESFAVASYEVVARSAPGKLGSTFGRISAEEGEHVGHAVRMLKAERERDPSGFDAKVRRMHDEVMTTLAEMLSRETRDCACGLCAESCLKPSLSRVGVILGEIRGASLRRYLKTLDEIGVPGELSLTWVAQLPV
jgi:fatty aldehyde decarbonylase